MDLSPLFALFVVAGLLCGEVGLAANPASGTEVPELAAFDAMMHELIAEHKVPGAALAIGKQGKLVYSRGFGLADVEAAQPVLPGSRFRIASISKPITAVAVLQLVEAGRLKLDDKVFPLLKLDLNSTEETKVDPRLAEITIRHCLQHSGGWDRDKSFDAMFRSVEFARALNVPPPAKAADVIRYMLRVPLDFDPGQRYAYSNFGYCLLGRAIEKLSGLSYETYVKQHVLLPLGIKRMQLGKTLLADRAEEEVRYYQQGTGPAVIGAIGEQVPHPYGAWYLEAMDSHGGWIASAEDLVRFAMAFNAPDRCAVLKPNTIAVMFAPPTYSLEKEPSGPSQAVYYACGWNIKPLEAGTFDSWHTGSLPGTSTILYRRADGIDWCVLFNQRDGRDARRLSQHATERIAKAIQEIKHWPE